MTEELVLDAKMTEPVLLDFAGGRLAMFSTPHPERESANEDALLRVELGDGAGVLAVADGAGGAAAGARASAAALGAVRDRVHGGGPEELRENILGGVDDANAAVAALGVGAATTLALVRVHGPSARSYHVGDSIVLVVGQRGKRKLETVAHSPVGYAIEAGILDEAEAMHHEERHLVSNMVGNPEMRVEISPPVGLAQHDTVLLASDGLSDNLHVEEIIEIVRKGPLDRAAAALADKAAARMRTPRETLPSKPDDLTFLLFRLG